MEETTLRATGKLWLKYIKKEIQKVTSDKKQRRKTGPKVSEADKMKIITKVN